MKNIGKIISISGAGILILVNIIYIAFNASTVKENNPTLALALGVTIGILMGPTIIAGIVIGLFLIKKEELNLIAAIIIVILGGLTFVWAFILIPINVGWLIGYLLTSIILLTGGILFLIYRNK